MEDNAIFPFGLHLSSFRGQKFLRLFPENSADMMRTLYQMDTSLSRHVPGHISLFTYSMRSVSSLLNFIYAEGILVLESSRAESIQVLDVREMQQGDYFKLSFLIRRARKTG